MDFDPYMYDERGCLNWQPTDGEIDEMYNHFHNQPEIRTEQVLTNAEEKSNVVKVKTHSPSTDLMLIELEAMANSWLNIASIMRQAANGGVNWLDQSCRQQEEDAYKLLAFVRSNRECSPTIPAHLNGHSKQTIVELENTSTD